MRMPRCLMPVVITALTWLNRTISRWHTMALSWTYRMIIGAIVIRTGIAAIRSITPLCTAYLLYSIVLPFLPAFLVLDGSASSPPSLPFGLSAAVHTALLAYSALEVGFFFYIRQRARELQRRRAPPPLSKEYREIFIRRVLIAICMVAAEDERASLVGDAEMIARAKERALPGRAPTLSLLASSSPTVNSPSSPSPTSPVQSRSPPLLGSSAPLPPVPLLPSRSPSRLPRRLSLSSLHFDVRKILQGWFYNSPVQAIWEENIIQWLCFGLFHRDWSEMDEASQQEMRSLWKFLRAGGRSREELRRAREEEENRLFYPSQTHLDRSTTAVVLPVNTLLPHSQTIVAPQPPPIQRSHSSLSGLLPSSGLPLPSPVVIHPGFKQSTRCMRVIIDPIEYQHRPLVLYGTVAALHKAFALYLTLCCHYAHHRDPALEYFHRPPLDVRPGERELSPLVFVHGISNGPSSYASFISRLNSSRNRHLFIVVLPFISMRICEHVPTAKATVEALKDAITRHCTPSPSPSCPEPSPPRFIIVGHSYGTLLASWFIKAYPHLLLSTVLIDPVCFMLFLPHLCFNFLYRQPSTPMHHLLSYFAAKELFISHTLHRHFFWTVNVLWAEDLTHIGEEEEKKQQDERREERQEGENWDQSAEPALSASTSLPNGHADAEEENSKALASASPVHSRKHRPPQPIATASRKSSASSASSAASSSRSASSPSPPGPELLLDALFDPLLRAPHLIRHLPSPSSRPPPSKCYVFLSEDDDIIYAPPVLDYLVDSVRQLMEAQLETRWREEGRRRKEEREKKEELLERLREYICCVRMWKHYRHAQFLTSNIVQVEVMACIHAAEALRDCTAEEQEQDAN